MPVRMMAKTDYKRIKEELLAIPDMTEKEAHVLATIESNPRFAQRRLEMEGMTREEYAEVRWSAMNKYRPYR